MYAPHAIRHILVPHDFSDSAERALGLALDLGDRLGARMTILHVYEIVGFAFPEGPALTAELVNEVEAAAKTALDKVVAAARRPGIEVTGALRQGSPWTEILAFAKESQADLIVMGTHGRRGLTRVLIGSVAERVVRMSSVPVLTVHGGSPQPA